MLAGSHALYFTLLLAHMHVLSSSIGPRMIVCVLCGWLCGVSQLSVLFLLTIQTNRQGLAWCASSLALLLHHSAALQYIS